MRTRKAMLPDAAEIHALIRAYSGDGTLLPRSFADICENIRDFVVAEQKGTIVGCGALHIYGPHLCEVRSIAVSPVSHGRGAGHKIVLALVHEARRHRIDSICLFTRIPDFFARLGFGIGRREDLPDKIFKDCLACPRLHCCDEVPMVYGSATSHLAIPAVRAEHLVQIG